MSMTVYFAKLNLISEDLFDLYDNPKQKKDLSSGLYSAVNSNAVWEKENVFIDDDGEQHSTIIEYSIQVLRTDNTYTYIEGWLYKKSRLYYKTLDSRTKKLVKQSTQNTEGIRFTLDVNHGFVGYNTSTRFGYKEFTEAFVNLINKGEEISDFDYQYNISMCTSGIDLNDIRKGLGNIGRIKELRIRMQPPNPSDDLLNEMQMRFEGLVEDFKDANVTGLELFYSTNGERGINLDSPFVKDRIDDIQGLHSALPIEEATKKGYVSVDATSLSGRVYSSGETKPFRKVIDGLEDFFGACIETFRQLW